MKVSTSKIWNESNYTNIAFSRKKPNALTFLFPIMFDLIDETTIWISEV